MGLREKWVDDEGVVEETNEDLNKLVYGNLISLNTTYLEINIFVEDKRHLQPLWEVEYTRKRHSCDL